jgi:hypothetical protein
MVGSWSGRKRVRVITAITEVGLFRADCCKRRSALVGSPGATEPEIADAEPRSCRLYRSGLEVKRGDLGRRQGPYPQCAFRW